MKLAILHPGLEHRRGAERVVVSLAEGLAQRRYDVTVITSRYDSRLHGDEDARSFRLIEIGGPGWGPASIRQQWALAQRLKPFLSEIDVINVHSYPAYSWLFLASFGLQSKKPALWYCNEPPRLLYNDLFNVHWAQRGKSSPEPGFSIRQLVVENLRQRFDRLQVNRMQKVLCNSTFSAERVRLIYKSSEISVCHLGTGQLDSSSSRSFSATVQKNKRFLLTVSPLHAIKNVEVVLKAVKALKDRGRFDSHRYVVVGRGPDEKRLKSLTKRLGIEAEVEFRGFVSDTVLSDLYEQASAVAYLPVDEPFGLVFLEAMMNRTPVVGPNHGGAIDIVLEGETGFLVDPFDVSAVASALDDLLRNSDKAETMGIAGQHRYQEYFTLSAFVDRFESHLTFYNA